MSASPPPATASFPPISYETWLARARAELGDDPERRLHRETLEGIAREPLYSADHLAGALAGGTLPRLAPRAGGWRIWQEVPISSREIGRAALAREVSRDLGGVWLRADAEDVTARDVATVVGEVLGADGVEVVLEGAAAPLAGVALLAGGSRLAGVDVAGLRGCLGCDPLGALVRHGSLPHASAGEPVVAAARWTRDHAPGLAAALVSTEPFVEAGADAVQEIAFSLAGGAETLRWLTEAGFTTTEGAAQVRISATAGRDLYLQLAKLRALRLTWAMVLAGVGAPPTGIRLHARTTRRTKGLRDPGTDLVRATLETLAAVLAGCSDITCAPLIDAETELALGMPLASATQLLLRDEVGLDATSDAAGGSWYVESLTAELARRAWDLFEGIERRGGMTREIAVGAVARAVEEASTRRRRALLEGKLPTIGVTVHRPARPVPLPHRPLAPRHVEASHAGRGGADDAKGSPQIAALVDRALRGATLAELVAATPAHPAHLRGPALAPWRDDEAAAEAEVPE
jgi:methylmalonyl-CoA mutase